jgi:hypothetical protein
MKLYRGRILRVLKIAAKVGASVFIVVFRKAKQRTCQNVVVGFNCWLKK